MTDCAGDRQYQDPIYVARRVRNIAVRVAADMGIEAEIMVASRTDQRGCKGGVRVNIAFGRIELILSVDEVTIRKDDRVFLYDALRARIGEMMAHRDSFAERLVHLRGGVETAIERANAGMRVAAFAMAPLPVWAKFDWRRHDLEASVETLDPMLRPQIWIVGGSNAREFAGNIRFVAPSQRRRQRRKARLDANRATLEIDNLAEAAITASGRDLGAVMAELFGGVRQVYLVNEEGFSGDRNTVSVVLWEGRIFLLARLAKTTPTALVYGSELRLDTALDDDTKRRVVGLRASTVLGGEPVLGDATVTSARARPEHYTDLKLRSGRRFVRQGELQAA